MKFYDWLLFFMLFILCILNHPNAIKTLETFLKLLFDIQNVIFHYLEFNENFCNSSNDYYLYRR